MSASKIQTVSEFWRLRIIGKKDVPSVLSSLTMTSGGNKK